MKKTILGIFYIIFFATSVFSDTKINTIYEGNPDAKIQLIVYESLTCSHCADFHKNVYLDMAALNASKIAHCKNDGKSDILHFLFENQKQWVKGSEIEEINSHLKKILDSGKYGIDFDKCIDNKKVEDHVLEDRIEAVNKFKINATPTLIINNKKFEKPLNYKNIKKALEKLI